MTRRTEPGDLLKLLQRYPLVLGLNSGDRMAEVLQHDARVVLTLGSTVSRIADDIGQLKQAGKFVIVDLDLVDGLAGRPSAVDFLAAIPGVDAILSTKAPLLIHAQARHITTLHRMFIVDSAAYSSIENQWRASKADFVNIQPGWPKVVGWARDKGIGPIIASGLVCDWQTVDGCIGAGAVGFCTTDTHIWQSASAFWPEI